MPKVSVIFPMYNVSAYIKNSLLSVLNQTYRDFELIAVNDGSTDDTPAIFRSVTRDAAGEIDISLIEQENGGLAAARNTGLGRASGEYVVFIDSDDVINPRYLETLVNDAEKLQTDLSVATFKMVDETTLHDFEEPVSGQLIDQAEIMRLMLLRRRFVTGCWCLLIKRELLEKNGLAFDTTVRFSVDQGFIWKVTDLAKRISINYSRLYHYYLRPGSIMTATKKEDIYSGVKHFTEIVDSLEHLPFEKEILLDRWKFGILHSASKLTDFDGYREVKEKIGVSYNNWLRIPDGKIKALGVIGMISEKALYRIFGGK